MSPWRRLTETIWRKNKRRGTACGFWGLLAALLNSSAGRRSLSGDAQLLAQRVLLGRERHELLVPEFHAFGLRERCHRMDHGSLPLRQFVDLTTRSMISVMFSQVSGWRLPWKRSTLKIPRSLSLSRARLYNSLYFCSF